MNNGFRIYDTKLKRYLEHYELARFFLESSGALQEYFNGVFWNADCDRYLVELAMALDCSETHKLIHVGDIIRTSFGIHEVMWDSMLGFCQRTIDHCKYEGAVPTIIVGNIHNKAGDA